MTMPQMTVEEFDDWVNLPENADKLFEYIGNTIIEFEPSWYHALIAARISFFLHDAATARDFYVTGKRGGYMVSGNRYHPSVALLAKYKLPELPQIGYASVAPELAVEVILSDDSEHNLAVKVANYLATATVVWIVRPDKKVVEIFVPSQSVKVLMVNDTIDGADVLPGFSLPVRDIFPKE